MLEEGTVRQVTDDGTTARVEVRASGACARCGNRGPCGASAGGGGVPVLLDAKNLAGARPGQRVRIEMNPENVWLATFLVFALPVILIIVGYGAGALLGPDPVSPWRYFGAALGLVAWILFMLSVGRAMTRRRAFRPTVVEMLESAPDEDRPE